MLLVSSYIMAARRPQLMPFWLSFLMRAIVVIYRERVEIKYFLLYYTDSAKTLRRRPHPTPCEEAPGGAVFLNIKTHAAGGENGSIMVGMFVFLCLASQKPSEWEFFVPARTDLGVKLF